MVRYNVKWSRLIDGCYWVFLIIASLTGLATVPKELALNALLTLFF